jgi:hypothetical protein
MPEKSAPRVVGGCGYQQGSRNDFMTLLAVRLIDLAIFGSLGGLWLGGAAFIVVLYRWILRFERGDGPTTEAGVPVLAKPEPAVRERVPSRVAMPQTATARGALASHS